MLPQKKGIAVYSQTSRCIQYLSSIARGRGLGAAVLNRTTVPVVSPTEIGLAYYDRARLPWLNDCAAGVKSPNAACDLYQIGALLRAF